MSEQRLPEEIIQGNCQQETGIVEIWDRLARSGVASRYLGQRPDGRHQVALSSPATGLPLAMGSGASVLEALQSALFEIP